MDEEIKNQLDEVISTDLVYLMNSNDEEREKLLKEVDQLLNRHIEIRKIEAESKDKTARRELEEKKNAQDAELELEKRKLNWKQVAFELSKALLPIAASLISYNVFQKRVIDFETHGRITSTAGRELHLPKIFSGK